MERGMKKERKTVGGIVNSRLLIRERSRSDQWSEREEGIDGLWILMCRGDAQKNNESREQALPSALFSFHSTLLFRLWNTVSHEPSSPSGSHCLHYNITFTVITSRTNKIGHWSAPLVHTLRRIFGDILLGYYWNTRWPFYFRDEMELAPRRCNVLLNQCSKVDKSDVTQQTCSQQKYGLVTKP